MGKIYSAEFGAVAVSAAQDLFSLLVGADEPIHLLGCVISQSSDVGDSAEEGLLIKIIRGWVERKDVKLTGKGLQGIDPDSLSKKLVEEIIREHEAVKGNK